MRRFMQILKIQTNNVNYKNFNQTNVKTNEVSTTNFSPKKYAQLPVNYHFGVKINFTGRNEFFNPNRTIPHIDYEEYKAMNQTRIKRFRKLYECFNDNKNINKNELFDLKNRYLPLSKEKDMDEFIKVAKIYTQYKDQPIICLGRSPKWFLNTALWMKDGINDYNFVAFSKYWYRPDSAEGIKRIDGIAPTEKEIGEYRKYLRRVKADPKAIVEHMKKTGKKTVITDYICSGKGASSFLEILGNYAKDLGILEKFSKAIQIVGIGSLEYMEDLNPYAEGISNPKVIMPPVLRPYSKNIDQTFYNMDYNVFKDMLLNQNTNECRSTYYPHEAWTVYKPDRFKTGLVKDMKKIKEVQKQMKGYDKIAHFTPAMLDFRNLLNFRILDALNTRNLLKLVHHSKL